MEVGVGTPPQTHKMLLDTGSAEIWINCAGCENCITDLNGVHIPPYNPSLSSTARVYNFTEDHCKENINGKCRFITGYANGRGMEGFLLEDKFLVGNPSIGQAVSANLRFGCVTKQNYTADSNGTDFFNLGVDGIMGFGDYGHSIVKQLINSTNISSQEFAHCLDNINGGGFLAMGHVLEPQVPMVDRFDNGYDLLLLGIDFGGANVTLNGSSLAVFDSGSDNLFVPELTFQDINEKFEVIVSQKNAVVKQRANQSSCFQIPGIVLTPELVDKEFPNITIYFPGSMLFEVSPHNYVRPAIDAGDELEGFWCFVVSPLSLRGGDNDIFLVGSSFMSQKLIVYDNINTKIGFTSHNCSVPIEVEGGDRKPIWLGPHVGDTVGKMF